MVLMLTLPFSSLYACHADNHINMLCGVHTLLLIFSVFSSCVPFLFPPYLFVFLLFSAILFILMFLFTGYAACSGLRLHKEASIAEQIHTGALDSLVRFRKQSRHHI